MVRLKGTSPHVVASYALAHCAHWTLRALMKPARSYLSRVRGVELLPGERVAALLSPDDGLLTEPPETGRLLVATDQRFMSIANSGQSKSREIFAIASVSGMSVRDDVSQGFGWKQWASLILGGIIVYVALAYWLVDRLPQIIIPGLNIHAFALVVMLLVVLAGWLFWRGFTQPGGTAIQIRGVNWDLEVPCAAQFNDVVGFAHILSMMQTRRQQSIWSGGLAERE